jgi:hypothetical protein
MGAELACRARFRGKTASGTVRLEADVLQFRGDDLRLSIPFRSMKKLSVRDGWLDVTAADGVASFDLGAAAARWLEKIQNPPSRLQKLGVKPDWRVSAVGIEDDAFLHELGASVAQLSVGRVLKDCDAIFFGATRERQLERLAAMKTSIKQNGALWVVRPKGRPEISERAVMAAGKAVGLVDVKVVSFSGTHTAEKFVIPVRARRP